MDHTMDTLKEKNAVDLVLQMLAIPGKPGHEGLIAKLIVEQLLAIGISEKEIQFDTAHKKSPIGGEVGNLIVKLPGTIKKTRRLLMAHIDTVPLCVGCEPVLIGNIIRSKNPATALGGDDRAGAAVVLNTIKTIKQNNLPHPPLTLFWSVQEEIGLVGARHVTVNKLGNPKACYNWDGGGPHVATIGATGDDHMDIEIHGIASHAGAHPEDGVSAIAIASLAIASLVQEGWFGKIEKGSQSGTSNIGFIHGGEATNVVTDKVVLRAEARSHNPKFRAKIVEAYLKAFAQAAKTLKNAAGKSGTIEFEARHKYESFKLSPKEPVVMSAMQAIRQAGLEPVTKISNGGLDANWMNSHGLPTVTLGCGQNNIHTVKEELFVDDYLNACRIAMLVALGATEE